MRKSLDEIQQIEQYIFGSIAHQEGEVLKTRLIIESEFQKKFQLQKEVYRIIQWFSRKQLKKEIKLIEQGLFQNSQHKNFQEEILNIFS